MAIYKIRDEVLLDIAQAIREKLYTDKQYYPVQFAVMIRSIETMNVRKAVSNIEVSCFSRSKPFTPPYKNANNHTKIKITSSATPFTPLYKHANNYTKINIFSSAKEEEDV